MPIISDTSAHRQLEIYAAIHPADAIIELRHLRDTVRSDWLAAGELPDHAERIAQMSRAGWQTAASVNPRRARGLRGDAAVDIAYMLVADLDRVSPDDALDRAETAGLPMPTMTVASGGGTHLYWRLDEPMPARLWKEWQLDLAAPLGADAAVSNPERLLRLPGYPNRRYDPPRRCVIIEADTTRRYELASLPIPMRPGSDDVPPERPLYRIRRIESGRGDPIERCARYVARLPAAVSGAGGHAATYRAAATCNRFGLSRAEAMQVMREYSARCDPPWSDREIAHKVDDAYRRGAHEHGDMLTEGRAA